MSKVALEAPTQLIRTVREAECPSISGQSTLTFAIGRHDEEATWHLSIANNSGKGMWFAGWASGEVIDDIVGGATRLTAKSFQALHPGRSVNTGGFILAALKELGLVRANAENTRIHEHVPTMTFEKAALASIDPGATKRSRNPKVKQ